MKRKHLRATGILTLAVLFLMLPSKPTIAQKLISETLQSKTLVEEDDGFKWYRYTYVYQVKYKGNTVRFTRESAYSERGTKLIDGEFSIDQMKKDCEYKNTRKNYKKYPSEIKEKYMQTIEYDAFYGLFIVNRDISSNKFQGTFYRDGRRCTSGGQFGKERDGSIMSGYKLGVVKNGKIVVPFDSYHDRLETQNGLYFCYFDNYSSWNSWVEVYSPDGVFIGKVVGNSSKEFFDGPNGEKWLKYLGYEEKFPGFYYCITSGKKIDNKNRRGVFDHDNIGRYLRIGGNLYTGDGDQITNYDSETSLTHLFNDGTADFFVVGKGKMKIEGNKVTELIDCKYGEIRCLNTDDGGDLFEVKQPFSPYHVGVMKVEGNKAIEVLDCSYAFGGRIESCGLYNYSKKGTDYYQDVVLDQRGNIIIPWSRNYFQLSFPKDKNIIEGCRQSGKTVYEVTLDLNGKELYCKKLFEITPQQPKQETKPQQSKQETKPSPTPTPQPQPQPVHQPQPMQVWQPCFLCGGSGQCRYCYNGWAANGKDRCGICNGTGKCSACAGHGGQNVIEYH